MCILPWLRRGENDPGKRDGGSEPKRGEFPVSSRFGSDSLCTHKEENIDLDKQCVN